MGIGGGKSAGGSPFWGGGQGGPGMSTGPGGKGGDSGGRIRGGPSPYGGDPGTQFSREWIPPDQRPTPPPMDSGGGSGGKSNWTPGWQQPGIPGIAGGPQQVSGGTVIGDGSMNPMPQPDAATPPGISGGPTPDPGGGGKAASVPKGHGLRKFVGNLEGLDSAGRTALIASKPRRAKRLGLTGDGVNP